MENIDFDKHIFIVKRTIVTIKYISTNKLNVQDYSINWRLISELKKAHTFATRALENHIPPKVVQEILGHSSITVTLDTYSHVLPNLLQGYMEQLQVNMETEFRNIKKKEYSKD